MATETEPLTLLTELEESSNEITFDVYGLWCSSCASALETQFRKIDGVQSANVNFGMAQATIRTVNPVSRSVFEKMAETMGYVLMEPFSKTTDEDFSRTKRSYQLRLAIVSFFSMWSMAFSLAYYTGEGEAFLYLSFATALPGIIYGSIPILKAALVSLQAKKLTFDLLFSVANTTLFLVSLQGLLSQQRTIYFESILMSIGLVLWARYFDVNNRFAVRDGLIKELDYTTSDVWVKIKDAWTKGPLKSVREGRLVKFEKSQTVLVDGFLKSNRALFDYSSSTGESVPILKKENDWITSGARVLSQEVEIQVKRPLGSRTIDNYYSEANRLSGMRQDFSLFDLLISYWAPITLSIAVLKAIHSFLSDSFMVGAVNFSIILLATCPCSLIIAEPLTKLSMKKKFEKLKAIFRLNNIPRIRQPILLVLDKTGTLVRGQVSSDIDLFCNLSPQEAKRLLCSISLEFPHPTTASVLETCDLNTLDMEGQRILRPGSGIEWRKEAKTYRFGKASWISDDPKFEVYQNLLEENGRIVLGQRILSTPYLPYEMLRELSASCGDLVLLTGDRARNTDQIGWKNYFKEIHTDLSPEDKARKIRDWKQSYFVIYIGDGLNDLLALAEADLSISVNSGFDSVESLSDVSLQYASIKNLPDLINVIKSSKKRLYYATGVGLTYNLAVIPFAIIYYVHPLVAVTMMMISSLLISTISLDGFSFQTSATKKRLKYQRS